ncbi:hypothetical protein J7L67_08880 [bacterium]|nr:hypothetical protein [bacterium]
MDTYQGTGLSLKDIQNEVCRRCFKDTSTFRSLITNWVNEAQQKISVLANGRWWWLEKSADLSIADSDNSVVLPLDFFELIDNTSVKDITDNGFLKIVEHKSFNETVSAGSQKGRPVKCTVFSQTDSTQRIMNFYPSSDGQRTIKIDYYKVLPDLINDEDVSVIPYWYQYLLVDFAVMRGQEHRQQSELAQLARSNWIDAISQLVIEADHRSDIQRVLHRKWRW